jgi:hypothetical protein
LTEVRICLNRAYEVARARIEGDFEQLVRSLLLVRRQQDIASQDELSLVDIVSGVARLVETIQPTP